MTKPVHSGAALISAMLTVTLVTSIAATSLGQQWRNIEIESAERQRVQSAWVLTGALDWARLILIEDARSGGADHLAEPWAVALEEARLTTFLAADTGAADSGDLLPQAFLSGRISDLQGRLNVYNLVDETRISEPDLQAFARLFQLLGLPPAELTALAQGLRLARDTRSEPGPDALVALLPQRLDQLVWLGLSPASLARLRPYITLLPARTTVNLNTASAQVLYASIASLDLAQAQRLVNARQLSHFRSLSDASGVLNLAPGQLVETRHGVSSRYFEVRGRLRLEQAVVEEASVVQRNELKVSVLWRERGAPVLQPAAPL